MGWDFRAPTALGEASVVSRFVAGPGLPVEACANDATQTTDIRMPRANHLMLAASE